MNERENFLKVFRRDNPERVPFDFDLCPSLEQMFKKTTGAEDYMEYYHFPYRFVKIGKTKLKTDFTKYFDVIPENAGPFCPDKPEFGAEWGVFSTPGSVAHFEHMLPPLAQMTEAAELRDYPFPDLTADYRWADMAEQVKNIHDRGLAAVAFMEMTIFEISWYMRGMERFMMDMCLNPDYANALLNRVTEIRCEMARKFAQAGVDMLMLGDDIATQRDMMMSLPMWREFFKYRLRDVIKSAKDVNGDILILYHSDGNCEQAVPELIEVGIDVLNPVQPECMDPVKMKDMYGNRLSFWGTLGTQTLFPFGTRDEMFEMCKKMIQTVGKDGGLLLAPTHMLEPEVPWDNIMAYLEAIEQFGNYERQV